MLRTRLWMGGLLILLAAGILVLDVWLAPVYPILFSVALIATALATRELINLLPEPRPRPLLCYFGIAALVLSSWLLVYTSVDRKNELPNLLMCNWGVLAAILLLMFVEEAVWFHGPNHAVQRMAVGFWVVAYIGYLATFFLFLRMYRGWEGSIALAMTIFVPKFGDIGAYTFGRLFGKHKMAPVLSPKKTWEGAAGGIAASIGVAVGINALGLLDKGLLLSWVSAVGFGVAVGAAGMIGDLMESMIKRDCERKDASEMVPGFGGVLDVLDSILFSAPVSFFWIAFFRT